MSADAFTSLDSQILPAAQGGSIEIFGVNKLSTPYTQAYAVSGSDIHGTASTLLHRIFETQNKVRKRANGSMPTDAVMGYGNLALIMEALENGGVGAGAGRQYFAKDKSASIYGWTEIEVVGVGGTLTCVGVNEMDEDSIKILDWRGIDLHTNGMFERHKDLNGDEYYVDRSTSGYRYITDVRMFGELVVARPSWQSVIYDVTQS
jgi:hypothetical protein